MLPILVIAVAPFELHVDLRPGVGAGVANLDQAVVGPLERRHDLIPNLVETVKGYAAHERSTFDAVTQARANAIAAGQHGSVQDRADAENALTTTLRTLFAVSEAYPDLKANQEFLALQRELTSTEGKVAYSRQFYNDATLSYNNRIQAIPGKFLAGPMHMEPGQFFDAEPEAAAPVKVVF